MGDIQPINLESKDLVAERVAQIKELFPEIVTEGDGSIDFEKLRLILGDEVDEGDERYAFTWPGKADAIRQAQTVSTATLRPCLEKSVNWDTTRNLYIEGDNLEVLKLLQRGYHGKVKMIFIDPPYNTGHDFVYRDSFGNSIENYKEQAGLSSQSNADTSGRYHSNWCSMMYPRLKLARELLSDAGIIAITIDDNEYSNLKLMADEIFGISNYLSTIVWQKTLTRRNDAKQISNAHDYILLYARKIESVTIKKEAPSSKQRETYTNRDKDPRGDWLAVPFHAPNIRPNLTYEITLPSGRKVLPPKGRCWSTSKANFDALVNDGRIWFGKDGDGMPQRKKFWSERGSEEGVVPWTWWDYEFAGENREATREIKELFDDATVFTAPKPTKLIDKILNLVSLESGIILDFFAGSSTTAHSIIKANHTGKNFQFVLVQIPELISDSAVAFELGYHNLCELGEERIRRAGKKIAEEAEESNRQLKLGEEPKKVPDIGFRALKLDDSGIAQPEPGQLILNRIKPDHSDEDILFEMMLKWGLDLSSSIEKLKLGGGYPCYSVSEGELVCCLADGLSIGDIQEIADMQPSRVLMLDSILDDTLKLNAVQIFKHAEEKNQITIDLRTV